MVSPIQFIIESLRAGAIGFSRCMVRLEVTTPTGTRVSSSQAFENAEVSSKIEHIVVPANEQNLERLAVEVLNRA